MPALRILTVYDPLGAPSMEAELPEGEDRT
jgi:hypothetical protein